MKYLNLIDTGSHPFNLILIWQNEKINMENVQNAI